MAQYSLSYKVIRMCWTWLRDWKTNMTVCLHRGLLQAGHCIFVVNNSIQPTPLHRATFGWLSNSWLSPFKYGFWRSNTWSDSSFSFPYFSSVTQSCLVLCDPMDCSTPGFPVLHQLPELAQTHVDWVSDAIQLSHPLSSPSSDFNLSQHQGLFQWISSPHQVAKVLELQLQHQSFQRIFRTDFL